MVKTITIKNAKVRLRCAMLETIDAHNRLEKKSDAPSVCEMLERLACSLERISLELKSLNEGD